MNNELKEIKKIYGEEMMHMCREMFPTILEQEGRLLSFLKERIAPTHSFASDVKAHHLEGNFKDWVYKQLNMKYVEEIVKTDKNPFELMEEAGYSLYECNSEEEIQSFKKYYAKEEELCTFNGGRLNRCHVFFAVKKDVAKIKREDFTKPDREDVYGTSVISIQFSRGDTNTLSIKNRYNHTVDNPDATFGNDLEMIIPGLTSSFEKEYGFNIKKSNTSINEQFLFNKISYTLGPDNRYYRYNTEIDATYYCNNNIIISDGEIITKFAENKERYILFDEYVIDLKEKNIEDWNNFVGSAFVTSIKEVGPIKKIDVLKKGENRIITIIYEEDKKVAIEIDKNNSIVGYDNPYVVRIYDDFLSYNYNVEYVNIPNVTRIDKFFLGNSEKIKSIDLPNIIKIGSSFMSSNRIIESFVAPQLKTIGDCFFLNNTHLKHLDIPNITEIGYGFLSSNSLIDSLNMPKLKTVGGRFLDANEKITVIDLPSLQNVDDHFLTGNRIINSLNLPNLVYVDSYFLAWNDSLKEVYLPSLKKVGHGFLRNNTCLEKANLPNLEEIGSYFLGDNEQMTSISLPSVKRIYHSFMEKNQVLNFIDLPQVTKIGSSFLVHNTELSSISLPNVLNIGSNFLYRNVWLSHIDIPKVTSIVQEFLYYNYGIAEIELPNLEEAGPRFMNCNQSLKRIYAPNLNSKYKAINPHLSKYFNEEERQK